MRLSTTVCLVLFSFLSVQIYCQELSSFRAVERHIATFIPSIHGSPEYSSCIGLVISPELLVVPSECTAIALQIMSSGPVIVDNLDGEEVGQLPDLSDDRSAQIKAAILPPMQLPFIPDRAEPEADSYPKVIPERDFIKGHYFVFSRGNSDWLPVGVNRVDAHGGKFALTAVDEKLNESGLSQLTLGSPVVSDLGSVLCLVGTGKQCHSMTVDAPEINDGSCHVQIYSCTNQTWSHCSEGVGTGSCIRPTDGRNCTVSVSPDGYNKLSSCYHTGGCGTVDCTCPSATLNCTCIAEWGYCSLGSEAESFPHGCLLRGDRDHKPRDPRCNNDNPTTPAPVTITTDAIDFRVPAEVSAGVLVLTMIGAVFLVHIVYVKYTHRKARVEGVYPNERSGLLGVQVVSVEKHCKR